MILETKFLTEKLLYEMNIPLLQISSVYYSHVIVFRVKDQYNSHKETVIFLRNYMKFYDRQNFEFETRSFLKSLSNHHFSEQKKAHLNIFKCFSKERISENTRQ